MFNVISLESLPRFDGQTTTDVIDRLTEVTDDLNPLQQTLFIEGWEQAERVWNQTQACFDSTVRYMMDTCASLAEFQECFATWYVNN